MALDTIDAAFVNQAESVRDIIEQLDGVNTPFRSAIGSTGADAMKEEWLHREYRAAKANAQLESGPAGAEVNNLPLRIANYIQTFADTVNVSTASDAVRKYGMDTAFADQIQEQMVGQSRDIEYADIGQIVDTVGANEEADGAPLEAGYENGAEPARQLSLHGLLDSTVRITTVLANLSEDDVNKAMAAIWDGTKINNVTRLLICQPADSIAVADFAGKTDAVGAVRVRTNQNERVNAMVRYYQMQFGALAVAESHIVLNTTAIVVDPSMCAEHALEPMNFEEIDAATAKARKAEVFCRRTLACYNKYACATIEGLTPGIQ